MNKQIIRSFDEFLNEEENFELDQELDILDELDMELDEEFGYDEEDELDEEFDFEDDFDSLDEDTKPAGKKAPGAGGKKAPGKGSMFAKDPNKEAKMKYKATLAPKLLMTKGTPKINSVLNAPMPGNIGYDKKGLKNRAFVASIAADFLMMAKNLYPGKIDKAACEKVLGTLYIIHRDNMGVKGFGKA
jgi:hypothetical protein